MGSLRSASAFKASRHGQIIENLEISGEEEPALEVQGLRDVVIRRCRLLHRGGPGLVLYNCRNLQLEQVEIFHLGAPLRGPHPQEQCNLVAWDCHQLDLRYLRVFWGSSGLFFTDCSDLNLQHLEGFDFRGPYPRGQLFQFNRVRRARVQHFFALNPPETSHPEDIVSVYESQHVQLLDGLLVGNNAPTGAGVMFEKSSQGRVVRVDTWHMSNGCFSAFPAHQVQFIQVRAARNHCGDQGRGFPHSGGLAFASSPESREIRVQGAVYDQLCNPSLLHWGAFDRFEACQRRIQPRNLPGWQAPWEEVTPDNQ